jgi:hypothetical protein
VESISINLAVSSTTSDLSAMGGILSGPGPTNDNPASEYHEFQRIDSWKPKIAAPFKYQQVVLDRAAKRTLRLNSHDSDAGLFLFFRATERRSRLEVVHQEISNAEPELFRRPGQA